MFRRRAAASIRTRNSRRSTPPISCSSAAERSLGSKRSSRGAWEPNPSALSRRKSKDAACAAGSIRPAATWTCWRKCQPVDLIKYRLYSRVHRPYAGRRRARGSGKEALVQILTKPKNAIIRQYQKLFEFENVRLKFSDDALEAVAQLAMERKVGARGLRMILEDLMLDLMYYLPSFKKVREFLVTKEMVLTQKINMAVLEKAG